MPNSARPPVSGYKGGAPRTPGGTALEPIGEKVSDLTVVVEKLTSMLKAEPEAGEKPVALWKKLKPLTPESMQPFWNMVEDKKTPMTDHKNTEFAVWSNEDGVNYTGMKNASTGEQHGIL